MADRRTNSTLASDRKWDEKGEWSALLFEESVNGTIQE